VLFSGYTMDDAFITFRYARNVALGAGWVYNVGGPPVEGFTNFLWTLLLVPCFWFRIDPMRAAQILGALSSLGVLALTYRIARRGMENPHGKTALAAPLLLALTGSFTYQAVTGLETQLFALGLVTGVYFFLRSDARSLRWSAGGFLVASLCRPEGLPLFAFTFAFLLVQRFRRQVESPAVLTFALVYGLPLALFAAWRVHTFGDWLPNTYYAKVGPPGEMIREGALYVGSFFQTHGTLLPWALAVVPVVWRRWRPREVYLLSLCLVFLAIVVYEGGDWMPLHRLLAPILPILYVLVAEGLDALRQGWTLIRQQRTPAVGAARALATLWLLAAAAVLAYPSLAVARESRVRQEQYRRSHVSLGLWLNEQCAPDDKVALSDIGQIGYYCRRWVIDLAGLTDRTIARTPGGLHKKEYDPQYVLKQKPKYIVLVCAKVAGRFRIRGFETEKRLYHHPEFKQRYRLLPAVSARFKYKDDYSYWVFERIDEPQAALPGEQS